MRAATGSECPCSQSRKSSLFTFTYTSQRSKRNNNNKMSNQNASPRLAQRFLWQFHSKHASTKQNKTRKYNLLTFNKQTKNTDINVTASSFTCILQYTHSFSYTERNYYMLLPLFNIKKKRQQTTRASTNIMTKTKCAHTHTIVLALLLIV